MRSHPQQPLTILEVTCRLKHFGFARYRHAWTASKEERPLRLPPSLGRHPKRGAPAGSALSGSHIHTQHALPLKSCLGLTQDATQQQQNDNTQTQTQTHTPMRKCTCIMCMCMCTGDPKPQHRPIAHIRQARPVALIGQAKGAAQRRHLPSCAHACTCTCTCTCTCIHMGMHT